MRIVFLFLCFQLSLAVAQENSIHKRRAVAVPLNDLLQEVLKFNQNLPTQFTLQYEVERGKKHLLSQASFQLLRSSFKNDENKQVDGMLNSSILLSNQHSLNKQDGRISISFGPAYSFSYNRSLNISRFGDENLAWQDRSSSNSFSLGFGGLAQIKFNIADYCSIGTQVSGLLFGTYQQLNSKSSTISNGKEQSSDKDKSDLYFIQFQGQLPTLIFFTINF